MCVSVCVCVCVCVCECVCVYVCICVFGLQLMDRWCMCVSVWCIASISRLSPSAYKL